MRLRTLVLLAALAWCAGAQTPLPDAAEQKAMVSRMRDAALSYSDQLQDFVCLRISARSTGSSPGGTKWKPLETQESELDYVDHREHYKLLKVNGETTDLEKRVKQGYFVQTREFGTALQRIFTPKVKAEFAWDHAETQPGGNWCVFRYHVTEADSDWGITANGKNIHPGHHGFVWAVCDTGAVMRFRIETDPAEVILRWVHVPIAEQLEVRYGATRIGDKEFLLPQGAVDLALFYKTWTKAEIQFQQYRKYDANSSLKFDEPPKR